MAKPAELGTPFTHLVNNQSYEIIPSFELECGRVLHNVPVAYKTYGKLNEAADNVMIICHAFTGSADVEDWWGPLLGHGRVFDPSRFFIFCANVLGSPYGSASPVTIDPNTGEPYGPEFPITTIRDDVRIHKLVLDKLGVRSVAVAIGGSMGGMAVLEWPLCTPPGYIRNIVPIATSARHSAWCISWGEAQRQSIYSDPLYAGGYYGRNGEKPTSGLAAARMAALLTYRSRDSFEGRFGRKPQLGRTNPIQKDVTPPKSPADEAVALHNDGNKSAAQLRARSTRSLLGAVNGSLAAQEPPKIFTAQSYLRYQGDKFNARFDANCYIHITRKMDTHDLGRGRGLGNDADSDDEALAAALGQLPRGALVIGIESDGLFMTGEQREIASHIPDARLVLIPSVDGHDGFLLEFEAINRHILDFLKQKLPDIYTGTITPPIEGVESFNAKKTSTFGEAEVDVDVTRW